MATNDQRVFTRTAGATRKVNLRPKVMRGGVRF